MTRIPSNAFLAIFLLVSVGFFSACVDLPEGGPPPPDYRSQTRYFHAGRGIDTVSVFVRWDTTWARTRDTSQTISGSDTILSYRTTIIRDSAVSYTRLLVDFGSSFELLVDGSSVGSMNLGSATPYRDTPSGARKIKLRAAGSLIDSVAVIYRDTAIAIVRDTLGPKGTGRFDTTMSGKTYSVVVQSGSLTAIVDSSDVIMNTQEKLTVFLMGDTVASSVKENRYVQFGWIRYLRSVERRTFDPAGLPDTAMVRFVNASRNAGPIDVRRPGVTAASVSALALFGTSTRKFPVGNDTTFTFYVHRAGGAMIDSLAMPVRKVGRYSIVALDSLGGATIIKNYRDE